MRSIHILGGFIVAGLLSHIYWAFSATTPFDFPDPEQPILSVILCLSTQEYEREGLLYLDSENDIGIDRTIHEEMEAYRVLMDEHTTFYGLLSDIGVLFEQQPEMGWLSLEVEGKESQSLLIELLKHEERIVERLFSLNRLLFGEIPPMKQKWRQAIRSVINNLRRKRQVDESFSLGVSSEVVSTQGEHDTCETQSLEEPIDAFIPERPGFRRRRSTFQGSSFWTKFLDDSVAHKPDFCLDQTQVDSEQWRQFYTIDIKSLDYRVIRALMPLFRNVKYFRVNNADIEMLPEPVQLRFANYNRILHIDLSFDENLFVHDYACIANNYPSTNYVSAKRKVICGPLYSLRVDEQTFIPSVAHPLISDATGTSGVLPLRTQKIFSSIPTAGKNIRVEFYGANFVTGIDFAERPVTSAILESLFQPNITTTFDPMATWDDRLGWASKFMTLRYLDLSRTNINDLNVLQNFKQLHTLVLRNMAFLEVDNARFLPHLLVIESDPTRYTWTERMRANWYFVRLSLYNFLSIKHDFYPILLFCFGIASWALRIAIKASVEKEINA